MKDTLKNGFEFWLNEPGFPELKVGKTYKLSFDFHPTSKDEGWFDNTSIKLIK